MKKRAWKLLTIGLVLCFMAVAVVGCGGGNQNTGDAGGGSDADQQSTSDEVINMRLATSVQPDHAMNVAALKFAEKVKEKSNGRINITVYPARQLGDDRQVTEHVLQGSLDMIEISAILFSNYSPLANAWQIPFLFDDFEQYRKVMKSDAHYKLLEGLEESGIKGLAVYNTAFRHLVTVDEPVEQVSDMKGLKLRTAESPLHVDIFQAFGSSPTPMPYGEIYSGLQNKVIDGYESDFSTVLLEKHYEVAKHITELKHFTWPALLVINKDKFESFSPEDQQLLMEAAEEVVDENIDDVIAIDEESKKELLEMGINVHQLSPEALAEFEEIVKPVEEKYAAMDPRIADFIKTAKETK